MPPLWFKWSHPTFAFTSKGSKIEDQERVAKTSYIRHWTSDPASGSMASGSTALAAIAAICSCQSEWQTHDKQIKALHEEAAEA
jgi:hypothetical protein